MGGDTPVMAFTAAIAELSAAFAPVPPDGSPLRKEWQAALAIRLNSLGAKIVPTMPKDQGEAWRAAITDALSDLPAMIALTAAKRAIHVPMSFINEVEGVVRTVAADIRAERLEAIARIERLIADLERASQPKLEAPVEDVDPAATAALIESVGNPLLRSVLHGIAEKQGWLPGADIDHLSEERANAA